MLKPNTKVIFLMLTGIYKWFHSANVLQCGAKELIVCIMLEEMEAMVAIYESTWSNIRDMKIMSTMYRIYCNVKSYILYKSVAIYLFAWYGFKSRYQWSSDMLFFSLQIGGDCGKTQFFIKNIAKSLLETLFRKCSLQLYNHIYANNISIINTTFFLNYS